MSRYSKSRQPLTEIRAWFNDALGRSDPKPIAIKLDQLARLLQVQLNRADNAELRLVGAKSLGHMKDVSLGEHLEEMADKVQQMAKQMLVPINELEKFAGGYIWRHPTRDIPLEEVRGLMKGVAFFARPQKSQPSRGQPRVPWKDAALVFAEAVQVAMRDIGYKGRLGLSDPESVPVIVTAAAISWAYGKRVTPSGFVTAMRHRDRRKSRVAPLCP